MGNLLSRIRRHRVHSPSPFISNNNSHRLSTESDINRLIFGQTATIGSLYDARTDQLLDIQRLEIPTIRMTQKETENFPKVKYDKFENKKLYDVIDIDPELYLSLYFKFVNPNGILLFLDYPFQIDKQTRFFSYYYEAITESSTQDQVSRTETVKKTLLKNSATHIVTKINYGIHVIIVLQLSSNDTNNLDRFLEKITAQLGMNTFKIENHEENFSNQIKVTKVFSNISDINQLTTLTDICQKLIQIKSDTSKYLPIKYTLRPIQHVCPKYSTERPTFVTLNETNMNQIQPYLYQLSFIRKQFHILNESSVKQLIDKYLKQPYEDLQNQMLQLEKLCPSTIKKINELTANIRNGNVEQNSLTKPLIDTSHQNLLHDMNQVLDRIINLQEKAQIIDHLEKKQITYWNMKEHIKNATNLHEIFQQLQNTNKSKMIYCFDDKLKQFNSSEWNDLYQALINEYQINSQLEYVYADFSPCSLKLENLKILPQCDNTYQQTNSIEEIVLELEMPSSETKSILTEKETPKRILNVLLLGESGVGKSTFINALANYLKFNTLEQVQPGQSIVIIPVSFLITIGENFEEKIVKFGEHDTNEDHQHEGQSVTQHCRSYLFNIDSQTQMRFIDTPGMGDTRGIDQDDLNMKHILSFISNLSHLDAICILLKPNESKLNVVLRSYFNRLLAFLGENARKNIIFCFTNTRSTFFAPGDTGPLLRKMLESHSIKNIPFEKKNTFCFDSESFRYLVACQNGIKFDEFQKNEYQQSWVKSVPESNRLLCYINELKSFTQDEWKSIEHAQFQIRQLIRPMLETMRNHYRNLILYGKSSSRTSIKLCPNSLDIPSSICMICKRIPKEYNGFWILPDELHNLYRCSRCRCDVKEHLNVDYMLDYQSTNEYIQSDNEISIDLEKLKNTIIQFGSFLSNTMATSKQNDLILSLLNQMITEEKQICHEKGTDLNSILQQQLIQLENAYTGKLNQSRSTKDSISLNFIYNLLKEVSNMYWIHQQMKAIKKSHQNLMTKQEKGIS